MFMSLFGVLFMQDFLMNTVCIAYFACMFPLWCASWMHDACIISLTMHTWFIIFVGAGFFPSARGFLPLSSPLKHQLHTMSLSCHWVGVAVWRRPRQGNATGLWLIEFLSLLTVYFQFVIPWIFHSSYLVMVLLKIHSASHLCSAGILPCTCWLVSEIQVTCEMCIGNVTNFDSSIPRGYCVLWVQNCSTDMSSSGLVSCKKDCYAIWWNVSW